MSFVRAGFVESGLYTKSADAKLKLFNLFVNLNKTSSNMPVCSEVKLNTYAQHVN